jgi:hypothetical protein
MGYAISGMAGALAVLAFAYAVWIMTTNPGRNGDGGPSRN